MLLTARPGPRAWGRLLTQADVRSTTVPLPSSGGLPALRLGTQQRTRCGGLTWY
jgi:glycine hydroxymethyltransferase